MHTRKLVQALRSLHIAFMHRFASGSVRAQRRSTTDQRRSCRQMRDERFLRPATLAFRAAPQVQARQTGFWRLRRAGASGAAARPGRTGPVALQGLRRLKR